MNYLDIIQEVTDHKGFLYGMSSEGHIYKIKKSIYGIGEIEYLCKYEGDPTKIDRMYLSQSGGYLTLTTEMNEKGHCKSKIFVGNDFGKSKCLLN